MRYWYIIGVLLSLAIIIFGEVFYIYSENNILLKYIEIMGWLLFLILSIIRAVKSRRKE